MNPIEFQSSTTSNVLSWIIFYIWLTGALSFTVRLLGKKEDQPIVATVWLGLCILALSPVRYMAFQVLFLNVYCVQSFSSFLSIIFLNGFLYVYIRIMGMVAIGLPLLVTRIIYPQEDKVGVLRGLLAGVLVPVSCILSSIMFHFLLQYAMWPMRWLDYKDLIKATNGSSAFVFKYVHSPLSYTTLPEFFKETEKKDVDVIRCHVATMYLDERCGFQFFKTQYPDLYVKLMPKPAISTFTLTSATVKGGEVTTGIVNLDKPSPVNVVVGLSSFNESVVSVPSNFTISAGQQSGTFQIETLKQSSSAVVTISASTNGPAKTIDLTVNP